MVKTKLQQLLDLIENSQRGISLRGIAGELDISTGQVENMLDYWVRKGRLQIMDPSAKCAACASSEGCSYLTDFPRILLLSDGEQLDLSDQQAPCQ